MVSRVSWVSRVSRVSISTHQQEPVYLSAGLPAGLAVECGHDGFIELPG